MTSLDELIARHQAPPDPHAERDARLYRLWRNLHCPSRHVICFGVSPFYGESWLIPRVCQTYGCQTPDDLVRSVGRFCDESCTCWRHAVLREVRRRLR